MPDRPLQRISYVEDDEDIQRIVRMSLERVGKMTVDVVSDSTKKAVIHAVDSTEKMGNVGDQLTLEKSLSLNSLPPGIYSIRIKVTDNVSQQTITPEAKFAVEQ